MDLLQKAVNQWQYASLCAPVIALLANAASQILIVRLRNGRGFLRSIVEGVVIGAFVLGIVELFFIAKADPLHEEWKFFLFLNVPTYLAMCYCYFCLANLGQTSIRIRLYADMAENPTGVSRVQIEHEYNEEALMKMRVDRLLEGGDTVSYTHLTLPTIYSV